MKSIQRILAIFLKEVRQLRRDRLTFGMIVGIPVIQLMMFGYAINMDVRHIPAGVADAPRQDQCWYLHTQRL
jgi:ABC-2 type transport system permease protein